MIELAVNGKPLLPHISPAWLLAKNVNAAIGDGILLIAHVIITKLKGSYRHGNIPIASKTHNTSGRF